MRERFRIFITHSTAPMRRINFTMQCAQSRLFPNCLFRKPFKSWKYIFSCACEIQIFKSDLSIRTFPCVLENKYTFRIFRITCEKSSCSPQLYLFYTGESEIRVHRRRSRPCHIYIQFRISYQIRMMQLIVAVNNPLLFLSNLSNINDSRWNMITAHPIKIYPHNIILQLGAYYFPQNCFIYNFSSNVRSSCAAHSTEWMMIFSLTN